MRRDMLKRSSGQGMTEYILIVALVAILTITVVTVFGKQLRAMFGFATEQLAGDSAATMTDFSDQDDGAIDTGLGDITGGGN